MSPVIVRRRHLNGGQRLLATSYIALLSSYATYGIVGRWSDKEAACRLSQSVSWAISCGATAILVDTGPRKAAEAEPVLPELSGLAGGP